MDWVIWLIVQAAGIVWWAALRAAELMGA